MKIFANKDIKRFFLSISIILLVFLLLAEALVWLLYKEFSLWFPLLSLLTAGGILSVCFGIFPGKIKSWKMRYHRSTPILPEM